MNRGKLTTPSAPLAFCFALTVAANSSCVKLPRDGVPQVGLEVREVMQNEDSLSSRVNINRASPGELERLPGIGDALAARIVEHRERYGPFRRTEHLLMVRGVSDALYRELEPHILAD